MIKTPLSTMIGGAFWTPNCTILGGASKTFDQLIKSLFANNEQGFAYDPNDLSTLYQDAVGTIPVTTAWQPVGLMLDKSKGLTLGLDFITPLDFTDKWVNSGALSSKTANSFTTTGAGGVAKTIGLRKSVRMHLVGNTTAMLRIRNGITGDGDFYVKGSFNVVLNNPVIFIGSGSLLLQLQAAGTATFTLLEVNELLGNHAYQTTSSMHPLLIASPQRLDYDTVDDNLVTNLPTELTGCTVIRSVPNVGTQILTNQTIPTTYEDNTDHCGLIVINRALTANEASQITKLFNKAAGV